MNVDEICKNYDSSIITRRWAALWIDFIICAGFLLAVNMLLGNDLYKKTAFIWMIVIAVYFPVLEGLKGYTVGKKLLRIRVVDQHGNLPGIPKAIVRSLLRIIETNPVFLGGVPAGIIALVSKKKQRLGDMLAKTYVVKTQDITTEIPSN